MQQTKQVSLICCKVFLSSFKCIYIYIYIYLFIFILYTITILGFPAGYQREANSFCVRDTIGTYRNSTEAALTCNGIPNCAAIYDYLCGKEMMYSLCLSSSTLRVSHIGSCVYVRGSNLASNLSTHMQWHNSFYCTSCMMIVKLWDIFNSVFPL